MTWFDYVLIGLWVVAMITITSSVGKPRKPVTSTTAAYVVAIDLLMIAGLLWARGVLG